MSASGTSTTLAEIRVPRETVNDDTVTIQSWHAAHGDAVKPKQLVVSIETSKAVLEVEAEAEGFLEIIHATGAEVPIGELISALSRMHEANTSGSVGVTSSSPKRGDQRPHTIPLLQPSPRSHGGAGDRATRTRATSRAGQHPPTR